MVAAKCVLQPSIKKHIKYFLLETLLALARIVRVEFKTFLKYLNSLTFMFKVFLAKHKLF